MHPLRHVVLELKKKNIFNIPPFLCYFNYLLISVSSIKSPRFVLFF